MLRALGSASCDSRHETGGTISYGHWGSASCDSRHETGGTICYGHWVLHLVIADTRQGHDLLRALGSASCGSTYETGGTTCCGYWVLHLVIADTRQGVRFVTGIRFCIL